MIYLFTFTERMESDDQESGRDRSSFKTMTKVYISKSLSDTWTFI